MRKKVSLYLAFLLLAVALMGWSVSGCGSDSLREIKMAEVERGDFFEKISAIGKTGLADLVDVPPHTDGTIAQLMVEEGDEVAAGDILAVLDRAELERAAEEARANYLAIASLGDSLISLGELSQSSYQAISSSVQGFNYLISQMDNLVLTLFDLAPLLIIYLPPEQQEYVKEILAREKAQYLASMNSRVIPQIPLPSGSVASALQASEAMRDLAYKQYQEALQALQKPYIQAPVAGAVIFNPPSGIFPSNLAASLSSSLASLTSGLGIFGAGVGGGGINELLGSLIPQTEIKAGTRVTKGQPIFQIADLRNATVEAEVEEGDIPKIKKGQKVKIYLDAYPDRDFTGTVSHVGIKARSGSTGATVFPVIVRLDRLEIPLRMGFNATVDIELLSKPEVLIVPAQALVKEGGAEYVWVVEDGVAHRRQVVSGAESDEEVEIVEGLEAGETVVTEGISLLTEGKKIK